MSSAASPRRDDYLSPGSLVVVALFSSLALIFILLKSLTLSLLSTEPAFAPFAHWHQTCAGELRPCLRATGAIVGLGFEYVFRGLAELMFWELARSPLPAETPWPLPPAEDLVLRHVVPLAAYIAYCFTCLLPILLAAFCWYRETSTRLIFVVVVFGALFGWHPVVVTIFFDAMSLIADWPRSYYLFWPNLAPYDFAALAVVMISLLYAGSRRPKIWWEMAALAAAAQLTIEYLGLVFGLALAAAALVEPAASRAAAWRVALMRLGIVGAASIVAAVGSGLAFSLFGHVSAFSGASDASSAMLTRWLPTNLSIWKVVVANVVTLGALALAGGALMGCFAGWRERGAAAALNGRIAAAAVGIVAAFLAVLLGGMVVLAYPAEMSRQFMPFALAMVVLGAKGLEVACASTPAPIPSSH